MKEALIADIEVPEGPWRSTASKWRVELHGAKGLKTTKAIDLYWDALQAGAPISTEQIVHMDAAQVTSSIASSLASHVNKDCLLQPSSVVNPE